MKNLVQLAVRSWQGAVVFVGIMSCLLGTQAQTFTSLEEALKHPKSVKKLDLSKQSLIIFPQEILQLTKLQTLELNHNPISQLPEGICQLKSLRFLEISGTAIKELPGCMVEMKKLKEVIAFVGYDLSYPPALAEKVIQMEEEMRHLKPRPLDTSVPPPPPPTEKRLNEEMELSDVPNLSLPDEEPSPNDFIIVTREPRPLNMDEVRKMIGYPKEAAKKKISGQVVVRVLIDKEGNYKRHTVVREAHPLLQNAVEEHITNLKFSPAIQGDKPIMFWVNIPMTFKL